MQLMHITIRELQVWNQLLEICLNTPPRPTLGHLIKEGGLYAWFQTCMECPQGYQSNGLELRIP
jgi:hypothetical protein